MLWVKLADHETAMTVRDVIVVYISPADEHLGTEAEVGKLLSTYQGDNPGHFTDEVPRLTARLLPGVGVGAEPPTPDALGDLLTNHMEMMSYEERQQHESGVVQFSFSTYRSTLIVRAIQDAGGIGGDKKKFQALVARYFAKAGIDPSNPMRQGRPDPSVLALLGLVRKKADEAEEKEKES